MGCAGSTPDVTPLRVPTPPYRPGMVSTALTPAAPFRFGSPISQLQLNHRRLEFWATRTDGDVTMWQAIRSAADAMLSDDIALANAILEASSIVTPNGSIDVCYDERGHLYKVPLFCYANPIELNEAAASAAAGVTKPAIPTSSSAKTVKVIESNPLNVKVRVNPGDFNLLIPAITTSTVSEFKQLIYEKSIERHEQKQNTNESSPICEAALQRVIFMGREVKNNQVLGEIGMDESRVVQVFLRQNPVANSNS